MAADVFIPGQTALGAKGAGGKKLLGLPWWAWAAAIGGGVLVVMLYRRRSSGGNAADGTDSGQPAFSGDGTAGMGGGGDGSGSGVDAAALQTYLDDAFARLRADWAAAAMTTPTSGEPVINLTIADGFPTTATDNVGTTNNSGSGTTQSTPAVPWQLPPRESPDLPAGLSRFPQYSNPNWWVNQGEEQLHYNPTPLSSRTVGARTPAVKSGTFLTAPTRYTAPVQRSTQTTATAARRTVGSAGASVGAGAAAAAAAIRRAASPAPARGPVARPVVPAYHGRGLGGPQR